MIPNYLEPLIAAVPHNATIRFNCPLCHGLNTLGITKDNGKVMWNCFRANCVLRDKGNYKRSIPELKTQLEAHTRVKQEFRLPEYLIYGLSSKKTLEMIIKGNCLEPYKLGLFDTAYDPVQDRVCFIVKKGNEIVGLIGKACNSSVKPKVYNYNHGENDTPFIVNHTKSLVLVEDCLSACSVTRIPELSGMALLGSSIKSDYIPILREYTTVIVALDRDARKKALAIKKKLSYYHSNIKLWLLNQDIKDMTDEQILCEYKSLGIN